MAKLTATEVQAIQERLKEIKSKRFRILEAMSYALGTINASRGYTSTVLEVSYDVKNWRDKAKAQCPLLYVVDDSSRQIRRAGAAREVIWQIRIFGVFADATQQAFEEFISDVEECLDDSNSLFGQINKMEWIDITTDNQLFSQLDGKRLFEMIVEVEYMRGARNPR